MRRLRASITLTAMGAAVGLLLALGFVRATSAAPTPRPGLVPAVQSLAVLIVSDSRAKAQRVKEEQMIALIHKSLDEQGLPYEVLPILTYHLDKPREKVYCEKSLGIRARDLVFLGLAQHQNEVVRKVILREPNIKSPRDAVAQLVQRAVAVLTGVTPGPASPKVAASGEPSSAPDIPEETPTEAPTPDNTPDANGAHVVSVAVCHAVNRRGQAVDHAESFRARDTFYVSSDIANLRQGTQLEVRWYSGDRLIQTKRLVSDRVGEYYVWFSVPAPRAQWAPGSYRVTLYVDGQEQATEYFRVNPSE